MKGRGCDLGGREHPPARWMVDHTSGVCGIYVHAVCSPCLVARLDPETGLWATTDEQLHKLDAIIELDRDDPWAGYEVHTAVALERAREEVGI